MTSQQLARRLIESQLDAAREMPGVTDPAQAALGCLSARLAIAAEHDPAVRKWLEREAERIERRTNRISQEQAA